MSNKNLHIFGIGNGIVDVQLTVEHHEFEQLQLRKGGMMLVAAEEQKQLIEKLSQKTLNQCSGGSAANTIIAFAQLGGKAGFGTRLGKDDFGMFYAQEFHQFGIELIAEMAENEQTGTSVVLITPDAERTMNTALAANLAYSKHHLALEPIQRSEWLYIEGYKLTESNGAEAVLEAVYTAKKHDTRVAVSVSDAFIPQVFGTALQELTKHADLIFCNEAEAMAFTGATTRQEAFRAMQAVAPNLAMTLGADGSYVWYSGEQYTIPAFPATPIDSTGAGDMYAAGFLYGITHGYSPEKAGKAGAYSAAHVISRLGARLPQDLLHTVKNEILTNA